MKEENTVPFSRDDWVRYFALKKNWFSASDSRLLFDACLKLGLIAEQGSGYSLAYPMRGIQIPLLFKPRPHLLSELMAGHIVEVPEEKDKGGEEEKEGGDAKKAVAKKTCETGGGGEIHEPESVAGPAEKEGGDESVLLEDIPLLVAERVEKTGAANKKYVIAEINKKQKKTGLDIEVASIIVGKKYGIDVSDLAEIVKKNLVERVKKTG